MQKDLVMGIDSSTTACKAIAWDKQGQAVAESRATYPMFSPAPNRYEQHADDWWMAVCQVARGVAQQVGADRIAALCVTNQRDTFVPVDEHGQPVRNALVWLDDRSRNELAELDALIGSDKIQDLTGKGPSTVQPTSKLLWLSKHEPDVVQRTYKFVEPHAFLIYRLTGRWATSLPCADPMGVVDMRRGAWAIDLIKALGARPDQFVEILPAGSIIGELTDQAASEIGLPAGIPVVAGAGDGQSAGLGANITMPGKAYLNLGTAMVSGAYSDTYVADRAFRTLCSPIHGAFVPEEVLPAGTFTVSWFVEQFGFDVRGMNLPLSAEEVLEVAAAKLPPGSLGLMLVPYWGGVMPPYWNPAATGITIGWTGAHRREHFYRAVLEGIAYEHRLAMDHIARAIGIPFDEYVLMGGGSRSPLWCQIVADVSGKTVTRAGSAEATNLGAAILAASALGWYPSVRDAANAMTTTGRRYVPDDKTHQLYDRLFNDVYVHVYPALQQATDRLAELTYNNRV
ncbi:MAG: FGGY-family carbohydrate kinase [Chloroflexota bacterium]|nr:FGGY-family carbohydrate kinase [Chloroflexota bacterium]